MHSRSVKLGRCLGSQDNLNFLKSLYFLLTMLSSWLRIVSEREMQGPCACDKVARPVMWILGDRRPSCYECLKWVGTHQVSQLKPVERWVLLFLLLTEPHSTDLIEKLGLYITEANLLGRALCTQGEELLPGSGELSL